MHYEFLVLLLHPLTFTCLMSHSLLVRVMSFFHLLKIHFGHQVTPVVVIEGKAPNLNPTDTNFSYCIL